jgi:alkylation response protein AidB-like acyl-CoA dehydrogenase
MDLAFTPDEQKFADEVRAYVRANLPADVRDKVATGKHLTRDDHLRWQQALGRKGWLVYTWPKKHGGPGFTPSQRYIFENICAEENAPGIIPFGTKMVGPVIYTFANDEQKQKYLPAIRSGEVWWCQGYSEPGSGSDLASLRTRAEKQGDHYVVNGSKTWNTMGHWADWIFCLVRTDPTAKKHDGIRFILFDMTSKGVTTKPILLISGYSPFCETFFDGVRVPKSQVVGTVNRGWDVAKYLLQHERAMISGMGERGVGRPLGQVAADSVGTDDQGRLEDPMLRSQISAFEIDEAALSAAAERAVDLAKAGQSHPAFSSAMKYYGTELNKRRYEILMSAGGADALEWESERSRGGARPRAWLRTKANSIEGGTSEVMLGIVAKRILDLPGA